MKKLFFSAGLMSLVAACATMVGPDNVSFPSGYKSSQIMVNSVDRADLKQVREIYTSSASAQAARAGRPLPHGTVFTMEVHNARADAKGELAKDSAGRLVKGNLAAVFVMEKRAGFGAGYSDDLRNGEWEYARFAADGQRPEGVDTKPCLQCHKPLAKQDFIFSLPKLTAAK